jgi:segregation and condensation protein B
MFLEKLGIDSLADLPPLADFVPGPEVMAGFENSLRAGAADPAAPAAEQPVETA